MAAECQSDLGFRRIGPSPAPRSSSMRHPSGISLSRNVIRAAPSHPRPARSTSSSLGVQLSTSVWSLITSGQTPPSAGSRHPAAATASRRRVCGCCPPPIGHRSIRWPSRPKPVAELRSPLWSRSAPRVAVIRVPPFIANLSHTPTGQTNLTSSSKRGFRRGMHRLTMHRPKNSPKGASSECATVDHGGRRDLLLAGVIGLLVPVSVPMATTGPSDAAMRSLPICKAPAAQTIRPGQTSRSSASWCPTPTTSPNASLRCPAAARGRYR